MMNCFYIKRVGWMMCLMLFFGAGCAELQGKSVQTYQSKYNAAVQASEDALKELEILILKSVSDDLRTDILARRADGTPVTVEVKRVDRNFTQVSVVTGTGVAPQLNRQASDQIHEFIRKQLLISPSSITKWPE
ncbi:MAG: DUF3568 family protein [Deltaproteobacteria bacterium]|nr:DUF3568 family protein [Deltaproteobacteria bacterium]MBW2469501.1 DUF3568 family protein [Deltaproteobacteria bacterium]